MVLAAVLFLIPQETFPRGEILGPADMGRAQERLGLAIRETARTQYRIRRDIQILTRPYIEYLIHQRSIRLPDDQMRLGELQEQLGHAIQEAAFLRRGSPQISSGVVSETQSGRGIFPTWMWVFLSLMTGVGVLSLASLRERVKVREEVLCPLYEERTEVVFLARRLTKLAYDVHTCPLWKREGVWTCPKTCLEVCLLRRKAA